MTPDRDVPVLFHLDRQRFEGVAQVANLSGDYTYLTTGYYASLDAELAGLSVLPTTREALDAYVVPIAMEKARLAGIPVPPADVVTERFPRPPLLAYPINPFSSRGELLIDDEQVAARRKGLTYTGKYAVLVQQLPLDHRIDVLRLVMGMTQVSEYAELGRVLFETFRLPLMKVRIVVTTKEYLLSAIEPLPFGELTAGDRAHLEGMGTWRG